jgi:hypothetical protein
VDPGAALAASAGRTFVWTAPAGPGLVVGVPAFAGLGGGIFTLGGAGIGAVAVAGGAETAADCPAAGVAAFCGALCERNWASLAGFAPGTALALALSAGAPISPWMSAATLAAGVLWGPSGVGPAAVGVCGSPDWDGAGLESEVAVTVGVPPSGDAGAIGDVADVPDAGAGIPAATGLAAREAPAWSGDTTNLLTSGGGAGATGDVLSSFTAGT